MTKRTAIMIDLKSALDRHHPKDRDDQQAAIEALSFSLAAIFAAMHGLPVDTFAGLSQAALDGMDRFRSTQAN